MGYQALEPLRESLGERFINAGVAEQNMVSVAAGLAKTGLQPWVYSIAPFVYARPFEQIRNDVCLHDLPVRLVGNGGGYAYGVMGSYPSCVGRLWNDAIFDEYARFCTCLFCGCFRDYQSTA